MCLFSKLSVVEFLLFCFLFTGEAIISSTVNKAVISFVSDSPKICEDWRRLGRELGVKDSVISNIAEELWDEGQREKCYQVLRRWYEEKGKGATVRELLTKLTFCGKGDIVVKLCKKLTIDNGQLRLRN